MLKRTFIGLFCVAVAASSWAADEADKAQVSENAPDSYVVKRGDTLWGISGMFLKQPWRWPEVWKMNQDQIRNPHLIYPGQIVVLDRNGPTLSLGRNLGPGNTVKLSPQVYSTPADSPITSVPLDAIRSFLVEPLVTEDDDHPNKPTVVAIQEERVIAGTGDIVYGKNLNADVPAWDIYRRGKPIVDPVGKQVLGYEAQFVGTAQVTQPERNGVAAEMKMVSAKQEVVPGDRMMPAAKSELLAAPPHAPAKGTETAIASIYGGVGVGGRNSVIVLAGGKNIGLEPGHVLALSRAGGTTVYRGDGKAQQIALPDMPLGLAYVFRTFNRVSYALVMEANGPVRTGDKAATP